MLRTLPFATGWRRSSPPRLVRKRLTAFVVRSRLTLHAVRHTRLEPSARCCCCSARLAGTFLVSFGLSMRVALRAREVSVPALAGVTVERRHAALGDTGPHAARRRQPAARRARAGRPHHAAGPGAGHTAPGGSARSASGSAPAHAPWSVPRLVGESERTARIRLEQGDIAIVADLRDPLHRLRRPTRSSRRAPTADTAASRVSLLVNRGEPALTYVMPDVVGTDGERAADVLRAAGPARRARRHACRSPDVPPGTVTAPAAAGRRAGGDHRRRVPRGEPMNESAACRSRRRSCRPTSPPSGATSPRSSGAAPT